MSKDFLGSDISYVLMNPIILLHFLFFMFNMMIETNFEFRTIPKRF